MVKIGAIICELNPFHLGHKYLTELARKFNITHIIGIMSGNFVQRGEPAIISKQARTEVALSCGFDLIIEIPSIWSISTAEKFALAGISIANNIGCVDEIIFGSECGNLYALDKISDFVLSYPFRNHIKNFLDNGSTFARARELCIKETLGEKYSKILKYSNNILGIEYINAIKILNSNIKPVTFARNGALHNSKIPIKNFCSSSYIRDCIINKRNDWYNYVPFDCKEIILNEINQGFAPITMNNLDLAVLYKLRSVSRDDLSLIPDMSEGLENRIYNSITNSKSIDNLISTAKTKRYTYSRIKRAIMCAFLEISNSEQNSMIPYIKVIGSNKRGLEILKYAKKSSKLPIISKYSDNNKLDINAKNIFQKECKIDDFYGLMYPNIAPRGYEQRKKFILKEG